MDLVPGIIARSADRSALSDELHFAAATPAERHQLDRSRANVLRALDIPDTADVLEIDAGAGALTRYLGETVNEVHAIERDRDMANRARARCEGLPNVRVTSDPPEDLPAGRYDLVVIVAESARDIAGSAAHLGMLRRKLRKGGALCIAFSCPEHATHAFRPTCRRGAAATDNLQAAGLHIARQLHCLPDPWFSRAVGVTDLSLRYPHLARALSTPTRTVRPDSTTGVTAPPGNRQSMLFIASNGAPGAALWQDDRIASYFNTTHRAARWCTRADVVTTPDAAEVRRSPLMPAQPPVGGVAARACTDPLRDAPTMLDVLLEQPGRTEELLTGWQRLLRTQAPTAGAALWDLVPHNVLVDGATLHPIDLEWEHSAAGVHEVTARGILVLAQYLCSAGWSGAAQGSTTRELAERLGVLVGLQPSFVDEAVARESRFAAIGASASIAGTDMLRSEIRDTWQRRLEQHVPSPRSNHNSATGSSLDDERRAAKDWQHNR